VNNPHQNARLTVHSREQIVARVIAGQTAAGVEVDFTISVHKVRKWLAWFRAGRLADATAAMILQLRRSLRMTGAAIATTLELARSTVARWLRRGGLGRLARIDPP